jgi:hypothetical protein
MLPISSHASVDDNAWYRRSTSIPAFGTGRQSRSECLGRLPGTGTSGRRRGEEEELVVVVVTAEDADVAELDGVVYFA